jgi:hypothetical protein
MLFSGHDDDGFLPLKTFFRKTRYIINQERIVFVKVHTVVHKGPYRWSQSGSSNVAFGT